MSGSADRGRSGAGARYSAERLELAPVALELLALGLDDLGRRVRDEALVREHRPRRGRSPCAAARARPRRRRSPARRSGFTTASKIRFSSPSSGDERRRCGGTSPPPPARASSAPRVGRVGRRAPATATTISRVVVELRPDLLGHVRHHRDAAARAAARARRARSRSPPRRRVQPRLDRLGVPVAEVVEDEVVERVGDVREVERAGSSLLDLGARLVDPPQDPALLERLRARAAASTPSPRWRISRATFQSLFASFCALLDRAPAEARRPASSEIFSRP